MKNLYHINGWSILITILLYFTFWGGIMAQFILGIIQIGMSLYIIGHFKTLSRLIKFLFITYGVLTISTFILFRMISENTETGLGLMLLSIPVTLCLALLHLYITYKIKYL